MACARCLPVENVVKHPYLVHNINLSNKTIFITSFLHHDVNVVITFYIIIYNKTSIFNLFLKKKNLLNFNFGSKKCIILHVVLFDVAECVVWSKFVVIPSFFL